MRRFLSPEYGRQWPRWLRATALAAGITALAGCGTPNNYNASETFAQCDVREFKDHDPVRLRHAPVDRRDAEAIKEAVIVSPDILIATAQSLHPDGVNGHSMLYDTQDVAHDSEGGSNFMSYDHINNPGDILCQVNELGTSGNEGRKVYYDQDGLTLLQRVQAELAKEYPANQ